MTKELVRAVSAVVVTVAPFQVVNAGSVERAGVLGALADSAVGFVDAVQAIQDAIAAIDVRLTTAIAAAEVADLALNRMKSSIQFTH